MRIIVKATKSGSLLVLKSEGLNLWPAETESRGYTSFSVDFSDYALPNFFDYIYFKATHMSEYIGIPITQDDPTSNNRIFDTSPNLNDIISGWMTSL